MTHARSLAVGLVLGLLGSSFVGCNPNGGACTPANCNGCCDEAQVCRPGDQLTACGKAGSACIACQPLFCGADGTCSGTPAPLDAGAPDASLPPVFMPDGAFPDDAGASSDAGSPDAGPLDGGGADAGSVDAGPFDAGVVDAGGLDAGFARGLYVSPSGNDANPGTRASPFLTLNHAATQALDGGAVIWLLDGLYDVSTQPNFSRFGAATRLPPNTTVRAEVPGMAVLRGDLGGALTFVGSGAVLGVAFENFSEGVKASTGQLLVQGALFTRTVGLLLSGDVEATLLPATPGGPLMGAPGATLASLLGAARLSIFNARIEGVPNQGGSNTGVITATNQSQLTLDGVTMRGNLHALGVVVSGTSRLVVRNSTLFAPTAAIYVWNELTGPTEVTVENSTLSADYGVLVPPFSTSSARLRIFDSVIADAGVNAIGLRSNAVTSLVLERSRIVNSGDGVLATSLVEVAIGDSVITGGTTGLDFSGSNYVVSMRRTRVTNHARSGVRLGGAPLAVDLGSGSDAGFNVVAGNNDAGTGEANLFMVATGRALAVGNQWDPNQQGTDSAGVFSLLPDGGAREFGAITNGVNLRVNQGSVRVAE